ncbi:hypothetical protein pb186bvf_019978 [Paramecium bursaria]
MSIQDFIQHISLYQIELEKKSKKNRTPNSICIILRTANIFSILQQNKILN